MIGDTLDEPDELVQLALANPTNATLGGYYGLGISTIVDDDPAPDMTITDPSVARPASGTTSMTFTVSLSAPSGRTVTVHYATQNATGVAGISAIPSMARKPRRAGSSYAGEAR